MSLFGDIAGAIGAENAEDAQFAASQQALAAQMKRYKEAQENLSPYMQSGEGANSIISRLFGLDGQPADMSAFEASPGYQFRLQQGLDALQNSAAARGGLFSGATGKAINDYAGQSASQEFDNYVNRLFGFSQQGNNTATNLANLGMGQAANMGQIYQNIGNNQASAIQNQWNSWGGLADQGAAAAVGGFTGGAGGAMGASNMPGAEAGGFNWQQAGRIFLGA